MRNFRQTFCGPVRRIRFLGLFDTVNSVPRFENAWLRRVKYPYTAKTSAKVIRHAVAIDERRAKFRVDLISGKPKTDQEDKESKKRPTFHRYLSDLPTLLRPEASKAHPEKEKAADFSIRSWRRSRNTSPRSEHQGVAESGAGAPSKREPTDLESGPAAGPKQRHDARDDEDEIQSEVPRRRESLQRRFSDLNKPQDILELWFPGNHSDIGGGYTRHHSETWQLAQGPLVWMIHEAQKAGLSFDEEKLVGHNVSPIRLDENGLPGLPDKKHESRFHEALHNPATAGFIHDCLEYGRGSKQTSVAGWLAIEHLPFRRMDLQPDGTWKVIRWPVPRGETRDIPKDAKIHGSVLRRIEHDPNYRPGNLIMLGKGGRGHRKAPSHMGTGEWVSWANTGDKVGEVFVSKAWAEEVGHLGEKAEDAGGGGGWLPKAFTGRLKSVSVA